MRVRSSELFPAYRRRVMANAATTLSPPHPGPGHPRRSASVPRNDVLTRAVSQRVALSLVGLRLYSTIYQAIPSRKGLDMILSLSLSLSLLRARACLARALRLFWPRVLFAANKSCELPGDASPSLPPCPLPRLFA